MTALVNEQIGVVEDEKTGAVRKSVQKEKRVEAEPTNSHRARNRLPFSEFVFKEGHSASVASAIQRGKQFGEECFDASAGAAYRADHLKQDAGLKPAARKAEKIKAASWGAGRRLLIDGGQGLIGRAQKWGGFVEHNGDGNLTQEALEFPLVLEGVKKGAVLHFLEDFDGDAARDVDTAERQNFQCKIARFRTVDGRPEIQGVGTNAAGFVQPAPGNFRSGVGIGIFERSVRNFRCEKFMKGAEAPARENEFPTDLRVAAAHEAQQFDLLLRVGSKVGMPAFRRHNAVASAVPNENRLPKAGARREQRPRSARLGVTRIQDAEIFRRKMLDTVARGPQIVQENYLGNRKLFDQSPGFHDPRKIGGPHAAIDDRAGDAEAGGDDLFASQVFCRLAQEFLDDQVELRKFFACKPLPVDGRESAALFREERQIALRAPNIPSENHLFPPIKLQTLCVRRCNY